MAAGQQQQHRDATAEETGALEAALAATQLNLDRADLMQLRMENEMMMAECRSHPRDFAAIRRELTSMLDAFPDFAYRARYCKPVGVENGVQKFARGLSIRAAEALAEAYKYNSIESEVVPLSDGLAKVTAAFMDFQNGRKWRDSGVVSQWYKAKTGAMQKTPDDRFYGLVCKAEVSRRIREVILRTVNSGLREWFEAECIKRAAMLLTDEEVRKIIDAFKGLGATLEQIENRIGRPVRMGWTEGDRIMALELWNAIRDGETTAAEAFGLTVAQVAPPSAQGAVSGDDLTKPKTTRKRKDAEPEAKAVEGPKREESYPDGEPPVDAPSVEKPAGDLFAGAASEVQNTGDELDADYMELIEGRIKRAADVAALNVIETKEIKPVTMSIPQRAKLNSLVQNRRKELA